VVKRIVDGRDRFDTLRAKPCSDCGGRFPPECMDFDHVRGTKVTEVSRIKRLVGPALMEEIAKCDLVCSNCHRIRTRRRSREAQIAKLENAITAIEALR